MSSFPECHICRKPFKWKGPVPYLLPCLHAICETCVTSAGEGCLHCSICERDTCLKIAKLMKDRVRERLILHLTAKHRPTELLCTHEDDSNQAVCWCQECEEFLCEHCQNLHESFKANKGHTISGISEIGTSEDEAESYCTIHKKYILEVFDHDCGVLICLKCKQGDHAGHSTDDIESVAESAKTELQNTIEEMNDVKKTIQKCSDEYILQTVQLKEDASAQREKISHTFDTLRALVDQRQKEITLSFDTHMDEANSAIMDKKIPLTLQHNSASIILEYTQNALNHASKSDLPSIRNTIRDTVKQCVDIDLKTQEQPKVSFLAEDLGETKSAISSFSGISYNGKRIAQEAKDSRGLTYDELEQRCESLENDVVEKDAHIQSLETKCETFEIEVTSLKQTVTSLESLNTQEEQKTQVADVPSSGSQHAMFHLLKAEEFSLKCVDMKLDSEKVNSTVVHINREGVLCNQPGEKHYRNTKRRLQQYWGTSSTEPLLHVDYIQYWETQAAVTLNQMISLAELILEIGICWEEVQDNSHYTGGQRHSYSLSVTRCQIHDSICRLVKQEGDVVLCLSNTFPHRQGSTNILHYGVLHDYLRSKIAFVDVMESKVIAVLNNVDTRKPLWPMFGVYNSKRGSVKMVLLVGKDITMSEEKKSLIMKALI